MWIKATVLIAVIGLTGGTIWTFTKTLEEYVKNQTFSEYKVQVVAQFQEQTTARKIDNTTQQLFYLMEKETQLRLDIKDDPLNQDLRDQLEETQRKIRKKEERLEELSK